MQNRAIIRVFAVLAAVSGVAPAFGSECIATFGTFDQSFGAVTLGASVAEVKRNAALKPCASGGQCVAQDEMDIFYESENGVSIDTKSLSIKQGRHDALPFGLIAGDSVAAFIRKVFPKADTHVLLSDANPENLFLMSGPCYKNDRGAVFHVAAFFDERGGLTSIGTFTEASGKGLEEFRRMLSGRRR